MMHNAIEVIEWYGNKKQNYVNGRPVDFIGDLRIRGADNGKRARDFLTKHKKGGK